MNAEMDKFITGRRIMDYDLCELFTHTYLKVLLRWNRTCKSSRTDEDSIFFATKMAALNF